MSVDSPRIACLQHWYQEYLANQDIDAYVRKVRARYTRATLERLLQSEAPRLTRRAAVLALTYVSGYEANGVLGRALVDDDRGVRMLAEAGLRTIWCRAGTEAEQKQLAVVVRLNLARQHLEAITRASELIMQAPGFAEVWNQRAIALFSLGRYIESIHDCQQTIALNPYHFGAIAGMGQCYLQMADRPRALESFRRALAINPSLEGVRANIAALERKLDKER